MRWGGRVVLWWKDVDRPSWFTPRLDGLLTCIDDGPEFKEFHHAMVAGANLAIRRSLYNEVGGFLEGLDRSGSNVVLGGGDVEFLLQARQLGYPTYYSPDVSVKHWVAPHRTSKEYLYTVSAANACGHVYLKPKVGFAGYLRGFAGAIYLMVKGWASALIPLLTGNKGKLMDGLILGHIGVSVFGAYFKRLVGNSPVQPRVLTQRLPT